MGRARRRLLHHPVRARRRQHAEAAGDHAGDVAQNVAERVFSEHHVELSRPQHHLHCGVVDENVFQLLANTIKLNKSTLVERVINPANISNSTTLTTTWIQSQDQANELIDKIIY